MVENEYKEILDNDLYLVLEKHVLWVMSCHKNGEQANLSKCKLNSQIKESWDRLREHDGTISEHIMLCEANLEGAYFQGAHLEGADFQFAHLEGACFSILNSQGAQLFQINVQTHIERGKFKYAHLEGAYFQGARLEGADFTDAHLEGADFTHAHLEGAKLARAHLEGANLRKARLEGADLREANLHDANVHGATYDRKTKCRGILVDGCYGSPMFKRFAQDQDFLEELQERSWWGKPLHDFWYCMADCGRTPWLWIFWSILFAVNFAGIFYFMGPTAFDVSSLANGGHKLPCGSYWTYLYYSVVTFTTLGFGDITPKTTAAAMVVMAEVIIGYIMLGGLISIMATLVARRSS